MVVVQFRDQMRKLVGQQWVGRCNTFAGTAAIRHAHRRSPIKRRWGDVGIPQVAITLHLGTRSLSAFRVGPDTTSERAQLREMLDDLPADSLLMAEAGCVGYELCQDLMERGQQFSCRAAAAACGCSTYLVMISKRGVAKFFFGPEIIKIDCG